jgi:hypothetical protein
MESKKTKSIKKHKKELSSFRNKMGSNLIWFNSLTTQKQYDLLFLWKQEKWRDKSGNRPKFIFRYKAGHREKAINPPLKFSHWIISWKYSRKFSTPKNKIRNSAIDLILNKK